MDDSSGSKSTGRPSDLSSPTQQDMSQSSTTSPQGNREGQEGQPGNYARSEYPLHQPPSHQNVSTRTGSFDMNPLGTALPEVSQHQNFNMQQPRYPSTYSPTGHMYQAQHSSQFPSVQVVNSPGNVAYNLQYQDQYQSSYPPSNTPSPTHPQVGPSSANQFYQNQIYMAQQQQLHQQQHHLQTSQYYVQPGQYVPQSQIYPGPSPIGHLGPRHSSNIPIDNRQQVQQRPYGYSGISSGGVGPARPSKSATQSSVVRGPPRKPRQSGHAIWIGNLPPQAELMKLVLHVCKSAPGLESLFLISKSNCAFANFKDETTCIEAQGKIHDSRFQTVRLVSRLRRGSVGAAGVGVSVPTGPAALSPPIQPPVVSSPSQDGELKDVESNAMDGEPSEEGTANDGTISKDKFFIVKSLTVEDLELSVRNGIWATQSHNEDTLNKAYQAADNVYLVFSANKSGEYFGYGRMISPINDDPAAAIEFAPKAQAVEDPELPKAISTEATEFVPKGRIIDDSARGTIFWEAERDEEEEDEESDSNKSDDGAPEAKAWGKPFKLEWLSTARLPFYRTRGLRNPWNQNREVKIARDGTELETTIGRRLIALFHRIPIPDTQGPSQMMSTHVANYPFTQ